MLAHERTDADRLRGAMSRLRGDPALPPDVSMIVPVNAREHLAAVRELLADVASYGGQHTLEMILVINNYPGDRPPPELEAFRHMGVQVLAIPNVRRTGEEVALSARFMGLEIAGAEHTIHFDADCRVPNATALIDWYVEQLSGGAQLAYTNTQYHGLSPSAAMRVRIMAHHLARWIKRVVLGTPTARGSNFALRRSFGLPLRDDPRLSGQELRWGPAVRAAEGRVVYSGRPDLVLLTSGRKIEDGWRNLLIYLWWRLRYNWHWLRTAPRADSRSGTGGWDTHGRT